MAQLMGKKATSGRTNVTVRRGVREIDQAVAAAAIPVKRGATAHFVVSYDSDLGNDGVALADAILARCEADYATLQGYFGGVTPPNLPFAILVTTDSTGAYHFSCAGTELFIGGRSASSANFPFILSLVVAEADEVFEAAVGLGWDCGASNGEGLSRVLANDMYPGAEPANFVSAPVWLDEPGRPDWVNQTEPTDRNYVSIGCAVLFLNWLRFQLGFSWAQIIAAGAPTLAVVYQNLTGQVDGFQRFKGQLETNFPSGTPSGLTIDQPYPLPGLPPDGGDGGANCGANDGANRGASPSNNSFQVTEAQRAVIIRAASELHAARAIRVVKAGESLVGKITSPPGRQYDEALTHWHPLMRSIFAADKPPTPPSPPLPSQLGPFNTGTISFDNGVPVGGWSQLTLFQNGAFNFTGHFHDSGAPSYNDSLVWGIVSKSGVLYTFSHSGHMAGTFESGSRDDDWSIQGTNAALAGGWADLAGGVSWRWQAAVNMDLGALINSLKQAISTTIQVVNTVIAIVG